MFEPYNEGKYFKFFNDPYQINVWRDPRDIYVSTKLGDVFSPNFESSQSIGSYHKSFTLSDDINNFITREKILISKCNFKDSNRILNIKFEDIVHNFEQSVDRISNFVGISFKNVNYIKEKINVENSKKNIGVWKAYDNQLEIDLISKSLLITCLILNMNDYYKIIDIKFFQENGSLYALEGNEDVPFDIKRIFYITNMSGDRANHAHYECSNFNFIERKI